MLREYIMHSQVAAACIFLLCLAAILSWDFKRAAAACLSEERQALLQFKKAAVEQDPSGLVSSWNESANSNCCEWKGVRCSGKWRVTGLLLNNCDGLDPTDQSVLQRRHREALQGELKPTAVLALSQGLPHLSHLDLGCQLFRGSIPSEIGNLTSLAYLDLSFQQQQHTSTFTGDIPESLWRLPNLQHVDFAYNSLLGSIPDIIGNCTQLNTLYLATNNLSGPIPSSLANLSRLQHLDFSSNIKINALPPDNWIPTFQLYTLDISLCSFTGPFPTWLSSQKNLSTFTLAGNKFTGDIPSWAWSLASDTLDFSQNSFSNILSCSDSIMQPLSTLASLDVSDNQLQGSIPCFISNLTSLTTLSFSTNSLTGQIPSSLGNLTSLQFLDLSSNLFTGTVPASMKDLQSLLNLDLDSNQLSGEIPSFLLQLQSLLRLDLSTNTFTGSIPSVHIAINSSLEYLKLSQNNLSSSIPSALITLKSLQVLRLDSNRLTGQIPKRLSLLSKLQTLDVSNNQLEGPLPFSIRKLSNLTILNIQGNQLAGSFPLCIKHLVQLLVLDLGSNQINGTIPTWIGRKLQQLQVLILSDNLLSGSMPVSLGQLKGMIQPGTGPSAEVITTHNDYLVDDMEIAMKGQTLDFDSLINMADLDLSGNQLSGHIPVELGELDGLISLDLSRNSLTGTIPSSLGNLNHLESLDLSSNSLGGQIPVTFTNLKQLAFVNLSSNHLHGSIPSAGQWDTFNTSSFMNNSGLCISEGDASIAALPYCGAPTALPSSPSTGIAAERRADDFINWSAFGIGYPVGVLLGFLLVLVFMRRNESLIFLKRFVRPTARRPTQDLASSPSIENEAAEAMHTNHDWEAIMARIQNENT